MQFCFHQAEFDQPHPERTRAIIKAYPGVRKLMGRNPYTFCILLALLVLQTAVAFGMGRPGMSYWWLSLLFAYGVGAFANHCMYVIIHDATHNLIFTSSRWNRIAAILADLPNLVPGAMAFNVYHLKHHAHQGDYDYDADLASHWEAKLVGNRWYAKMLWLLFFPLFQVTRPQRLKAITMWNRWIFINLLFALSYDVALVHFFGWPALLYLTFSFFFSIGLHPVGARWIQEHYTHDFRQETTSYYGPVNMVALNVGYHNEHHDFPTIPWNKLPQLKSMAPEFYDNLKCHPSWTRLLMEFLFDQRYSLFSRIERIKKGRASHDHALNLVCQDISLSDIKYRSS